MKYQPLGQQEDAGQTAMAPPENSTLDSRYDVLRLNVISSTSIASRTTLLIRHLTKQSAGGKVVIASLHAKAPVANKLISAIEITKRELSQNDRKVYQYSAITSERTSLKHKETNATKGKQAGNDAAGDAEGDEVAEDDEDEAFEVMGQKEKIRDVPALTVFLSLASVKELRDAHG